MKTLDEFCAPTGAPVYASQPHFAGAHKDYVEAIEGLTPHGDYSSFVDLEPVRFSDCS